MKKFFKDLWNDESGQGMTEYLLLLVALVAIVMMFGDEIRSAITDKVGQLKNSITAFE